MPAHAHHFCFCWLKRGLNPSLITCSLDFVTRIKALQSRPGEVMALREGEKTEANSDDSVIRLRWHQSWRMRLGKWQAVWEQCAERAASRGARVFQPDAPPVTGVTNTRLPLTSRPQRDTHVYRCFTAGTDEDAETHVIHQWQHWSSIYDTSSLLLLVWTNMFPLTGWKFHSPQPQNAAYAAGGQSFVWHNALSLRIKWHCGYIHWCFDSGTYYPDSDGKFVGLTSSLIHGKTPSLDLKGKSCVAALFLHYVNTKCFIELGSWISERKSVNIFSLPQC